METPEGRQEVAEYAHRLLSHDHSVRRSMLAMIVAEARRYAMTADEIRELVLAGQARPELLREMEDQARALGVTDELVRAEVRALFDADRFTVDDLLLLVQGFASQADRPILPVGQAREIAEMALRLSKQTRRMHRRMEQARVLVEAENPPSLPPVAPRRQIRGAMRASLTRIAGRGN